MHRMVEPLVCLRFFRRPLRVFLFALGLGVSLLPSWAHESNWGVDWRLALDQVKQGGRDVLVACLGSDWSKESILWEYEVFSAEGFAGFSRINFILVKLDFLQNSPEPETLRAEKAAFAERYRVEEFPVVILLNPDGIEIGRVAYAPGGFEEFMRQVNRLKWEFQEKNKDKDPPVRLGSTPPMDPVKWDEAFGIKPPTPTPAPVPSPSPVAPPP
jgi:hypothetical protein